jgi:organic hydroperoxide reductase OsmC/OhrA
VAVQARTFSYAVWVDRDWSATSERGGTPIPAEEEWTPEHLVLAGLARCTLTSLRYHCVRAGVTLTARATAQGTVTKREEDGRFAFVLVTVEGDVSFEPKPDEATIAELLAKGERDCFVGASLTVEPAYTWRVA